jgi:hypothetical protein
VQRKTWSRLDLTERRIYSLKEKKVHQQKKKMKKKNEKIKEILMN